MLGITLGVLLSVALEPALPWLLDTALLRGFIETAVQIETQVTMWSIIASFVVASAVGLGFGVYPALIASRQDPIVALRHD